MKRSRKIVLLVLSILVSLFLITAGTAWRSTIGPNIIGAMSDPDQESNITAGIPEDEPVMEGKIGMMSLIWDGVQGRDILDEGEFPTTDMFETVWKDIKVTGRGVMDSDSGLKLFDSPVDSFSSSDEGSFPIGGVEKRDYEIFNQGLNRTVKAEYIMETEVLGRRSYVFSLNISNEEVSEVPDSIQGEFAGKNGSPLPFEGEIDYLYSDRSSYFLDPRTSIPLDLNLDITSSFLFPDSTLLQVQEEQVQYSEETIWLPSDTIPGKMESHEVIIEKVTRGEVSREDSMVALYEIEINYYDRSTGEPLEESVQPDSESFAVDRESYRYLTGYEGTKRSGYYQFPVGDIEQRDYPMWDENTHSENTAEYTGKAQRFGYDVFVYRMTSEDVVVEAGNALIPIYYHPGTEYKMDTVQDWYIDADTGVMLDMTINGTIKVTGSGPLDLVEESVGSFWVDLPDNTTDLLKEVADLYNELLLPMSEKPINAFSMRISFTDTIKRRLIETSDQVVFYLDILYNKIPGGLIIFGMTTLILTIAITTLIRKYHKNNGYLN